MKRHSDWPISSCPLCPSKIPLSLQSHNPSEMEGNRTRTGHPSSRFSSVSRGGPSLLVPGCGGSKPPFRPVTATARKHLGKNRRPQCRRRELPQQVNSVCALAAGRVADAEGNVSLLQLTKCGLNLIYAGSGNEAKPQCQNCTAKGFACKYPSKVTFVSIVHASNQQSDGTGATYSTIRVRRNRQRSACCVRQLTVDSLWMRPPQLLHCRRVGR